MRCARITFFIFLTPATRWKNQEERSNSLKVLTYIERVIKVFYPPFICKTKFQKFTCLQSDFCQQYSAEVSSVQKLKLQTSFGIVQPYSYKLDAELKLQQSCEVLLRLFVWTVSYLVGAQSFAPLQISVPHLIGKRYTFQQKRF